MRLGDHHPIERVVVVRGQRCRSIGVGGGDRQLEEIVLDDLRQQVGAAEVEAVERFF